MFNNIKNTFLNDKKYYRQALYIAWPSVLESFFIAMASMIDTIMVSSLGLYAISAIGLTTQPKFIALTAFFAINTAVSALVARRKGQDDRKGANEVFLTSFLLSLILCTIITLGFIYYADEIIHLSASSSDTHSYAVTYIKIIVGFQIFNIIAMSINAAQRGSGNTKIAFTTNLTSSIINIIFNYLLINGNLGFPAWGVFGAAVATVLGTVVASILSIRSLFSKNSFISIPYIYKNCIKPKFNSLKIIFSLGSNMFAENILMRIGFLTTAITAAKLGTNIFAVHNAGMTLLSIGFSFADGMQVAAIALSGRSLGSGNTEEAKKYVHVSQRIGFMISIILFLVLVIFGRFIMSLFINVPDVLEVGVSLTRYMMIIVLLQISQVIYGGALRAGGDVKFTLIASIISVAIVRTLVTIILVNVFNFGIDGIWLGIFSDQILRFILVKYRISTGIWTRIKI